MAFTSSCAFGDGCCLLVGRRIQLVEFLLAVNEFAVDVMLNFKMGRLIECVP
jgi:hypothetical protein